MATEVRTRPTLLRAELRSAWAEYLEEVRTIEPGRYPEVEPWAWQRLQAKLRLLKRKAAA